ncbi:MAG: hypothetical protein HXY30_16730 [Pseudorhodoplanes sp.]|nr:hypothetical protein [Pseudorhodoplanes sp.]
MSTPASTPPADTTATALTRFNAIQHGVLSRYTVLPWEDADEYDALVAALVAEHAPQGPTEEHLVEDLAGILWRERRLRLAEAAAHKRGLESTMSPDHRTVAVALVHLVPEDEPEKTSKTIRATASDTERDSRNFAEAEAIARSALGILGSARKSAYKAALAALHEDTMEWWAEVLARKPYELNPDEEPATAATEGLRRFFESDVLPWFEMWQQNFANRPLIREQAFGEALDPDTWNGSPATKCISIASSNERWQCCCA